ncbi:hypothetical protein HanIR_Chr09g0428931 [Helianthus annuus]|nr:hypothetical protein HanIR_Chr09g0428931 [Helianthus annuus]
MSNIRTTPLTPVLVHYAAFLRYIFPVLFMLVQCVGCYTCPTYVFDSFSQSYLSRFFPFYFLLSKVFLSFFSFLFSAPFFFPQIPFIKPTQPNNYHYHYHQR